MEGGNTEPKKKSPARRPGRRPASKDDIKARILATTCDLLNTVPPDKISVMMVSRALDIDASLVRYYFKSRSGLLIAAASELSRSFYRAFDKLVAESDGTPEGLLRARIKLLFSFDFNYPYYYRLIAEEVLPSSSPEAAALRYDFEKIGIAHFGDLLAERGIRPVHAGFLRILLLGACEFFRQAPAYAGSQVAADDYQDFLVDVLANGLKERP